MDRHNQITQSGRPVTHQEAAQANEYFEPFLNATTLKSILGYYRSICDFLHLKPNVFPLFYPKLRTCLNSWRAKALWKKFDARASHKCYGKGKICANTRVLIIGAGPCGLRTAIEAQLLGAKVVVIEKRDRLSRNNVLHLWPFVIEDLRALGAKKFFGKFCAGAIDHISIRQLQCILLKVALLLGVEVHTEVSFENLIEPSASDKIGWRAEFKPADHPVSQYEFDVIIGADGKRNTLQGFKRKEFRGKLAIAITANFINKKTEAEARVEEISGVAFIFNQKFFKDLQEETRIDLENIVYYKDDTHYFVMTAKKASLLEKGVIKQDLADTERLLAPDNVDRDALENYAREAANFSTNYQMPDLEFAVNHYGQPDVAMFDFTSMYAAENASKVLERNGYRLLMILVGDSLLEPFWPTGSGCARGFLSSLDAAWAIRSWSSGTSTGLEVLAERESLYRLLAQTTPDNLNKDCKSYTLDPVTRYPNLNKNVVMPHQTICLFDTDNPKSIERMRRNSTEAILNEQPKKRRRGNVDNEILINWISEQVREHENITVTDLGSIFRDGKILCAIINHYRPDLLDYNAIISNDPAVNNQQAFEIFEKELGIPPIMTGEESVNTEDYLTMASYLTQVYDVFRGEIPHIKHPKLLVETKTLSQNIFDVRNKSSIKIIYCSPETLNSISHSNTAENTLVITKCLSNLEEVEKKEIRVKKKKKKTRKSNKIVFNCINIPIKCKSDCDIYKKDINISIKFDASQKIKKIRFKKSKISLKNPTDVKSKCENNRKIENINMNCTPNSEAINKEIVTFDNKSVVCTNDSVFKITVVQQENEHNNIHHNIKFEPLLNLITISQHNKSSNHLTNALSKYAERYFLDCKFIVIFECLTYLLKISKMNNGVDDLEYDNCSDTYFHVSNWISKHNFKKPVDLTNEDYDEPDPVLYYDNDDNYSNLSSVSKSNHPVIENPYLFIKVEERSDVILNDKNNESSDETFTKLMKNLNSTDTINAVSKFTKHVPLTSKLQFNNITRSLSDPEFSELPETVNRRVDLSFKSFATIDKKTLPVSQASRPSSRHKRHADAMTHNKQCSMERKIRKRRILEKIDACIGEHDNKLPNQMRGPADEDFAARIKSLEDKWTQPQQVDKKPKDLLRAIGKIETSDWNIKEIEKKIMENKLGKPSTNKDKEKVPKWSKEQFLARQTKMEKQHMERQDSAETKYADIDKNIKFLDLKLKEGTARDLGQNKVASITEKLTSKVPVPVEPKIEKTNPKPVVLPTQSASEVCHFCNKRVYLMERLSAEGRFFHHGCFKCQYCHTQLRLGSYAFDRDGLYGHKFFCLHHYGMQGEIQRSAKITRKPSQKRDMAKSPDKKLLTGVSGVDLLDRIRTPERIEFANLSTGHASSDQEESLSQMDEDEWTDKNFGASAAELDDSDDDDSSSSLSDSESDEEDAYDDALEEPATKEGTLKWAERLKNRYRKHSDDYSSSDQSSYYENSSDDDESDTATEGEEEIRARELRKQEVRVEPPIVQTDTGTDTEVVSSETSSESSSEVQNSATEISTDSEFAQDDPTPTRELPIKDFYVTKTRGSSNIPKRIQVTSGYIQKTTNEKAPKSHIELKLHPLVPSSTVAQIPKKPVAPLFPRTEGYALNRTQSTGGIAAKVSLELKKKYLLGEPNHPGNIQKSGSASLLDNKFKSFHTNITDCQKLLKPATEISASMQTFCNKLDERSSPVLSPQSPISKHMPIQEHIENTENTKELPPPDVTNVNDSYVFENECEGRPRSPAHETSIIVPKIDWSKKNKSQSEDSLSESSSSSDNEVPASPNFHFINIPRVEVHTACDDDDLPPDSLCIEENKRIESSAEMHSSINSEQPKSIASEKKSLNQPKSLPTLENVLSDIHNVHIKKDDKNNSPDNEKSLKTSSGRSTPDSNAEQGTAAFTETELSDWARDGNVSDDLEFELNEQQTQEQKKPKEDVKIADISEFEEIGHLCDKLKIKEPREEQKPANILNSNLDNIEFMDTGTETSSDDGVVDSQNGYVLFKDEDELAEDSLNPNINNIVEATNLHVNEREPYKNTGYCIIASEENNFGGEVIDLKPSDLEKLKQKQFLTEHEEDSLLIVETGTTTEENTCSDSTVKNVTEIPSTPTVKPLIDNNNSNKQRLEEKLAQVKAELTQNDQKSSQGTILDHSSVDFDEHCQRLQSKVEFGNAKDSIDIRKSRRKSKSEIPQKPDLIQEEKEKYSPMHTVKDITLNLSPTVRTPDIIYKKENIMKERDVNQKLIQEMVMNKMKAENKSLERKKRNRSSSRLSPSHPYDLAKSATTDIVSQINLNNLDKSGRNSTYSTSSSTYATPDVLLTTNSCSPLQNSTSLINVPDISGSSEVFATPQTSIKERNSRPLSVYATFAERKMAEIKSQQENKTSLPDIRKNLAEEFRTPIAPPRQKYDDLTKTAERLKQDARIRARLLSNEELGLSPEDKLQKLREKVAKRGKENEYINSHIQDSIESLVLNTERRNSCLYSNDTLKNKKNSSFRRSKSGDCAINNSNTKLSTCKDTKDSKNVVNIGTKDGAKKIFKSDPNLLNTEQLNVKTPKKSKDRERRKSITKMITTLFTKKSPTGAKGLFSKISPKTKDLSKDILVEEPVRRKSLSEIHVQNISNDDLSPPPIPPLPLNYTGNSIKGTDDSSDGEHDWKKEQSSCDTLDQSGILENSMSSLTGRRSSGKVRKQIRQAQLKRHRMAQEIQRKLEETEVKTRELERRGVQVEKALRGEGSGDCSKEESELLQEWFDLMRDRTELRRYEKELMVRAQELELEDRHARLQQELRERLDTTEKKTDEDIKVEESIISEMMDIVVKRDSLIAVLEEDRLRYSNEDRDLEEQMLAKGLRLTPIRKSTEQ